MKDTEAKGVAFFDGKLSSSFVTMTAKEWSVHFYKNIDHHFAQYGA